jgi:hypothetical protein
MARTFRYSPDADSSSNRHVRESRANARRARRMHKQQARFQDQIVTSSNYDDEFDEWESYN